MRRFSYRARNSQTGQVEKGAVQAETENAAGKLLLERGLTPLNLKEDSGGKLFESNKVAGKDKIVFTRQFATLVGAGLPLSNSLRTVGDQTDSKPMKKVIDEVLADVEAGKTLTDAFKKHPDVFDNVYIALISAGEASGTLDLALKRLADQQEKDEEMMSSIRGALTYPAIVLLVIIAVMVFMIIVVVPQVEGLYNDLGKDLPVATAVMSAIADFLMSKWYIMMVVIGVIVWFMINFSQTDTGKKFMANFKLNVPMFKNMFKRLYMARFARTAQNLLSTGVPMIESLQIAGRAMNNMVVENEILEASKVVQSGKPLSEALEKRDYMLPLVPQMASIGEQSGKIDEMLGKAAKVYEDELDEQIRTLSTMIEPILMVVMAVLVGGMVAAILFPIYSLVNEIHA